MNLHELRSTMVEHAEALDDAPQARVVAVRRRVALARRRRRAALAVTVAAAVAAVGLVVAPAALRHDDAGPSDAPSRLAGRHVPRTQTATGFTYRYAEGHESKPGQGSLDVDVPLTGTPQLVMWASSDTTSAPVVSLVDRTAGADPQSSAAGGFSRYLWLGTREEEGRRVERLRLTQSDADSRTRLAVAVYTLAGMPNGSVTDGTVAYRQQVAGESLVKAVIGRRGQTDLSFDVRLPTVSVSVSPTCYGATGSWTLDLGGGRELSQQCSREPEVDAGSPEAIIDGGPFAKAVRAGDTVRVHMRLTGAAPGAVLGVGLYTHHVEQHTVAGQQLPDVIEESGHEWQAISWRQSAVGSRSLQVRLAARQPLLVRYAEGGLAETNAVTVRVATGGGRVRQIAQNGSTGGSGSSATAYVVQPGASPTTVTAEASQGGTATGRLGLVTYRLVH